MSSLNDELREQIKYALEWYHAELLVDDNHIAVEDGFVRKVLQAIAHHKTRWELEAQYKEVGKALGVAVNHNMDSGKEVALVLANRLEELQAQLKVSGDVSKGGK